MARLSSHLAAFLSVCLPVVGLAQTADPGSPTLVVMITVDGLRASDLEKHGSQFTGGLARFIKQGAWFTNAHQDHAITETAPGHASLLSGRFPRSTGIAANRVGVLDQATPLLGTSGVAGASPKRFQGTALFDWIRAKDKRSRALSVSTKDRGAILPIGKAKEQVYWYPGDGSFTTSTYYTTALPEWVTSYNARSLARSYAGRDWTLLLPESAYSEPDAVSAEGAGRDNVFPHPTPSEPERVASWLRATPFIDELTASFALEGVRATGLGSGPQTDLLAISLSATDAINHRLGPDSREAHDQLLRTDRVIGQFLDSLFRLRDSSRVVVALSADHGFTTIPELAAAGGNPQATRATLEDALVVARAKMKEMGVDTAAIDIDQQIVLLDRQAFQRGGKNPQPVLDAFIEAARKTPGVARVDKFASLLTKDTLTDPIARRWSHQFPAGTNVELVATQTPGTLWTTLLVASHGSPYDADSHVPIMFLGAGFKPGRYTQFVRTVDVAPTLARVLRVTPLEKLDGAPLTAVLR